MEFTFKKPSELHYAYPGAIETDKHIQAVMQDIRSHIENPDSKIFKEETTITFQEGLYFYKLKDISNSLKELKELLVNKKFFFPFNIVINRFNTEDKSLIYSLRINMEPIVTTLTDLIRCMPIQNAKYLRFRLPADIYTLTEQNKVETAIEERQREAGRYTPLIAYEQLLEIIRAPELVGLIFGYLYYCEYRLALSLSGPLLPEVPLANTIYLRNGSFAICDSTGAVQEILNAELKLGSSPDLKEDGELKKQILEIAEPYTDIPHRRMLSNTSKRVAAIKGFQQYLDAFDSRSHSSLVPSYKSAPVKKESAQKCIDFIRGEYVFFNEQNRKALKDGTLKTCVEEQAEKCTKVKQLKSLL